MPSNLPERINRSLQSRRQSLAARAQESAELEIFRHGLSAAVDLEKELIDGDVIGQALKFKTDIELKFLEEGLKKANGSPVAVQIVAENAELLFEINTARVTRRFGRR